MTTTKSNKVARVSIEVVPRSKTSKSEALLEPTAREALVVSDAPF
jgi:hypothetical protein